MPRQASRVGKRGAQAALGDLLQPDLVASNSADNMASTIDTILAQLQPTPLSGGEGALPKTTFRAMATRTPPIDFTGVTLAEPDGAQIPADVEGGSVK